MGAHPALPLPARVMHRKSSAHLRESIAKPSRLLDSEERGQRTSLQVEGVDAAPGSTETPENLVDHRLDDRLCPVVQQKIQDADVGSGESPSSLRGSVDAWQCDRIAPSSPNTPRADSAASDTAFARTFGRRFRARARDGDFACSCYRTPSGAPGRQSFWPVPMPPRCGSEGSTPRSQDRRRAGVVRRRSAPLSPTFRFG